MSEKELQSLNINRKPVLAVIEEELGSGLLTWAVRVYAAESEQYRDFQCLDLAHALQLFRDLQSCI